jgi:hypothetical protein
MLSLPLSTASARRRPVKTLLIEPISKRRFSAGTFSGSSLPMIE